MVVSGVNEETVPAGVVGLQQQVGRVVLHGAAGRRAGAPRAAGAVRRRRARAAPGRAARAQLRGHPAQLPRRAPLAPPAAQAGAAPPLQARRAPPVPRSTYTIHTIFSSYLTAYDLRIPVRLSHACIYITTAYSLIFFYIQIM